MSKKRPKRLTILIVPEDNAEPYSFRFDMKWVKLFYVIGSLVLIHIIAGAFFYWKYAQQYADNQEIKSLNAQLEEDNKRVLALADQYYALERFYRRVSSLLGIKTEFDTATGGKLETSGSTAMIQKAVSTTEASLSSLPELKETRVRPILTVKNPKLPDDSRNLPTLLPVKGFVSLEFQKEGWLIPKTHHGIDIVAKKGSVVHAAGSGVIIFANWTYDLGNLIIIDHGGGLLSYYGHNERLLKNEKTYVKKGEPIALVGSSGKSSGPHLHFEIRKDGAPVDPKEFILAFHDKPEELN